MHNPAMRFRHRMSLEQLAMMLTYLDLRQVILLVGGPVQPIVIHSVPDEVHHRAL